MALAKTDYVEIYPITPKEKDDPPTFGWQRYNQAGESVMGSGWTGFATPLDAIQSARRYNNDMTDFRDRTQPEPPDEDTHHPDEPNI